MTEYYIEKFYNEYAIKQEDTIIAVLDSGTNARKVCDLLNEQGKRIEHLKRKIERERRATQKQHEKWDKQATERIKELEKEKEFWKHNCIFESSRNSILIFELGFAKEQGYKWSDAFEKYENSVKENSEWNKRYFSEKENRGEG